LILKEATEMVILADPRIAQRWLGHYAYLPNAGSIVISPEAGVTAVSQTNGQGMTHGFSIAEEVISNIMH
jgi:hypothetical protein